MPGRGTVLGVTTEGPEWQYVVQVPRVYGRPASSVKTVAPGVYAASGARAFSELGGASGE
jgi:hypothetical protein